MGSARHHVIQNDALMLVTAVTKNRRKIFADAALAREVIETLYRVQQLQPFFLFGFVVMPNHCHLLVNVPSPGSISKMMQQFKAGISHNVGLGSIWQARFHMKAPESGRAALHYIHDNPVKSGLVESAQDYRWSSASGLWDVSDLEMV